VKTRIAGIIIVLSVIMLSTSCMFTKVPVKQYYVLNYTPSLTRERLNPGPYDCTVRLREFNIEEAYRKPQIVYRKSPFQLQYYVYQSWAVNPERIITDLLHKHLLTANLVSNVVRRFDEGHKPDYEINGIIEAIEEYDSDKLWFAHIALRITIIRMRDGRTMYSRRFDHRKRVFENQPEYVVREMSALLEYIFTQTVHDFDVILSSEFGTPQDTVPASSADEPVIPTTAVDSMVIEEQK
jgi:ABC-type uncharacterized transport system auxiliary subunit